MLGRFLEYFIGDQLVQLELAVAGLYQRVNGGLARFGQLGLVVILAERGVSFESLEKADQGLIETRRERGHVAKERVLALILVTVFHLSIRVVHSERVLGHAVDQRFKEIAQLLTISDFDVSILSIYKVVVAQIGA